MPKLICGQIMPDFTFNTPFEKGLTLAEASSRVKGKTILMFLRYYGCTLCQLDIRELAAGYEKLKAKNAQLLIVLQSKPSVISSQIAKGDLPFDIICDPEAELYKKFDISPAKSMLKMLDGKALSKIIKSTTKGIKHGEYEGNEQQLPATFILDSARQISYAHYGKSIADIPNTKQLLNLLG